MDVKIGRTHFSTENIIVFPISTLTISKIMTKEERNRHDFRNRLTAISLSFLIGAALMAAKFYVYHLTRSSAVFSDALESIINVVAAAFALVSIILASRPPDKSHPYGHGKVEYFSAGFEGALIILAAIGIFKTGLEHILHPQQMPNLELGLLILFGTSLVNLALGVSLVRVGKNTHSFTLIADGKHVLTDVYTSAGVLVGLFLVHLTGFYWLDGTVACLVGFNILFTGINLVRKSLAGLMDAAEPGLLEEIAGLLEKHRKEDWVGIHELRAYRSGAFIHVDLHLILPRTFTLEEAHREAEEVEAIIEGAYDGRASVLVHLDACADPDCPACRRNACRLRKEDCSHQGPWSVEIVISERAGDPPLWESHPK